MRCFGLFPESVLGRTPAVDLDRAPSLPFSIIYGAVCFGAVSVLAYSIWAFRLIESTGAMYTSIALIYIGLTGLALGRLVVGTGATTRFALLFALAFIAYALAWCAFWFGLKGKHHADLWGALMGLAGMTCLISQAFGHRKDFLPLLAVLFMFHSVGYYLGDIMYAIVRGSSGRLWWGALHGLGFGAGLGYVLHQVQAPLRRRVGPS
jgi:hypothetical protein